MQSQSKADKQASKRMDGVDENVKPKRECCEGGRKRGLSMYGGVVFGPGVCA